MIDVRLEKVSKRYVRDELAVDAIDLDVEHGTLLTLLGPSGCGKTTTLKMISGFEDVTSGDIFVGDERLNDVPAHRRDVTTVFQNYALFPHMRVFANVAYGLKRRRVPHEQIRERVGHILEVVGLSDYANRYPSELSGGQQQRVALARSLVLRPKLLLLDEPLSNLDAKLRKRMEVEIREILHETNVTAIHVTHDQEEALTMSDMVAVMNAGRIEQVGPPTEIYRHPTNRWVAQFIGISNLLPLHDARYDGDDRIRASLGGRSEVVSRAPRDLPVDRPLWLMTRPEALRAIPDPSGGPTAANQVRGRVVSTLYLGRCTRLEVRLDRGEDVVTLDVADEQDRYAAGDEIHVAWEPAASWVLAR